MSTPPAPPSAAPHPGEVISGKFRVERTIGEGGVGVVLEATHLQLDERVALKFLRQEAMQMPDVVERFALEARAAVKLKSEHVARVIDVGTHGKLPYMVMEFLEGEDLDSLIVRRGPLPVNEAVDLIIQAAEGISEAHSRGIIHRDLKPANLFLAQARDGWPTLKVLDFGISKAALTGTAEQPNPSKTLSMVGSPLYMSPEQIRSSRDVERFTDIWSLGAVLFELLTGQSAFTSQDLGGLMAEIISAPHRRLRSIRHDAPAELEAIIDRCLSKSPENRFQSAAELAMVLLPFTASKRARVIVSRAVSITRSSGIDRSLPLLSQAPPASGEPGTSGAPAVLVPAAPELRSSGTGPLAATQLASSVSPTRPRSKRGFLAVTLGGVALVAVIAVFVFVQRGSNSDAGRGQTTSAAPVVTGALPEPPAASAVSAGSAEVPVPIPSASASATPAVSASSTTPTSSAIGQPARPLPAPPRKPSTLPSSGRPPADPPLDIRRER